MKLFENAWEWIDDDCGYGEEERKTSFFSSSFYGFESGTQCSKYKYFFMMIKQTLKHKKKWKFFLPFVKRRKLSNLLEIIRIWVKSFLLQMFYWFFDCTTTSSPRLSHTTNFTQKRWIYDEKNRQGDDDESEQIKSKLDLALPREIVDHSKV